MPKLSKEEKLRRKKEREAFDLQFQGLYDKVKAKYNYKCAECDSLKLTMHHIDFDHYNMVEENLIPLCWPCHIKRHHGYIGGKKLTKKEISLKVDTLPYIKKGSLEDKLKILGITKSQFADKIGVDPVTVSRWINGERKIPKIVFLYLELLSRLKSEIE